MLLKQLVTELSQADNMFVQSFQHDHSMSAEVSSARRMIAVFDKIRDHPDSLIEVRDDADFEKELRVKVEEIALAGGDGKSEIDALVASFTRAHQPTR